MKRFAWALLCLIPLVAAAQNSLDGRRFDTQAGFTGKPAHIARDILSFAEGKFHSSDCDQYGYDKGTYRTTANGDSITFEVETRSEQYGRNVWKGVIRGDSVEGTMMFYRKPTWYRPNPEPLEHWFKGKAM